MPKAEIGQYLTADNVVQQMLQDPTKWIKIKAMVGQILKTKAKDERREEEKGQ